MIFVTTLFSESERKIEGWNQPTKVSKRKREKEREGNAAAWVPLDVLESSFKHFTIETEIYLSGGIEALLCWTIAASSDDETNQFSKEC